MTDIPEQFADVPRLKSGSPDYRTRRGKQLQAYLEAQTPPQAPQEPVQATVTAFVPSATPMPSLGTSQSGQWLLAQIAEAYPEIKYNQWNRVKATFVHAQRNLLAWRRLTNGR